MPALRGSVAAILLTVAAAASACGPDAGPRSPGTERMAERLAELAAATDTTFPYANTVRLRALREADPPEDPDRLLVHRARIAQEELRAGHLEAAIEGLAAVREALGEAGWRERPGLTGAVTDLLAVAHLRLAERENCVEGPPGTPGCLVPVPPEGVHRKPRGARGAAEVYRELLRREPDDLGARWMLNVAHMMLGDHPEGVPERWRIPAEAFAPADPGPFGPEGSPGRFPDRAREAGVAALGHAGGAALDDFDGDGDLDVVTSSWLLTDPVRFFRNRGDGTFEEATREAGLEGITGGLNLVHADYDGDGDLDVLVLRGGWLPTGQPNSLLRNDGSGRFSDVTEEAGLLDPWRPTQTAAWADFDGDGHLDLFIGNESWEGSRHPGQLFRNRGDGTFEDVAPAAGADVVGVVKAAVWGDYDDDGRPDLFLSRRGQTNVLLRNAGPDGAGGWRFEDVSREAGVEEPLDSFPAWFWDYDNDGRLDLFVSGYRSRFGEVAAEYLGLPHGSETPRLYRNRGDGTFEDVTEAAGLDVILFAMGANFGDLDGDGWQDLYAGTGDMDVRALVPNRAFRNAPAGRAAEVAPGTAAGGGTDAGDGGSAAARRFHEVTTSAGLGHIQKGHGIAFGDVDGDGDQDIYANLGGAFEGDVARNALFENPGGGGRWVTLRLEGVRANRSAIGARVRLVVETAGGGTREIHRVVGTGGSFGSSSLQLEVGLGDARALRRVEVRWPGSGRRDVHEGLALDRIHRLREGGPAPEPAAGPEP